MSGSGTTAGGRSGDGVTPARLLLVVGTRPNFVKAGPVHRAAQDEPRVATSLVHTGQHYDAKLSQLFFEQLALPEPDDFLGVGSGSHAEQTAEVMRRLEPILIHQAPACVVVFGDVNSTVAAALTAAKLNLPVAHVEAGLRSFDQEMPEEINRRVTDCLSDLLFTTEESGNRNLLREGIADERVVFVGNTMVDSLMRCRQAAHDERAAVLSRLGLGTGDYALLTLHRPANVDDPSSLRGFLEAIEQLSRRLPVVFPVHPRTRRGLDAATGRSTRFDESRVRLTEPLSYLDFLGLMDGASLVLTDSGGIQEETTVLGVPCLTLRDNTERPVTVSHGTNRLVGTDPAGILPAAEAVLDMPPPPPAEPPPLWDGAAAPRIVAALADRYCR
ncbi:MAG: non-hydrolyzing UDP-N-acetylglucosamine 2-epimerase [Thermoanaerobaculia bacterium]